MLARTIRVAVLVGLTAAGTATPARADALDELIAQNGVDIVDHLEEAGYKSVGVLKFEVAEGTSIYLNRGRMNEALATRVENALILALDTNPQFGVVRNAGAAVSKADPKATYETPDGRKALFGYAYPLAFLRNGQGKAPVDAFLTGRLTFSNDLKTASLTLRLFDKADPTKWRPIPLRTVQTDAGKIDPDRVPVGTGMLSDIGKPYVVLRKRNADAEDNAQLVASADGLGSEEVIPLPSGPVDVTGTGNPAGTGTSELPHPTKDKLVDAGLVKPNPTTPVSGAGTTIQWQALNNYLDFRAYYDGNMVSPNADGNFPDPQPGQKVYFSLKSNQRIGLTMLVNGVNTADYDRTNSSITTYTKWVLEPGKEYFVRGYYTGKELHTFEVPTVDRASELLSTLGSPDKLGLIELSVYIEAGNQADAPYRSRGVRNLRSQSQRVGRFDELHSQIKGTMYQVPKERGVLAPGSVETFETESTKFTAAAEPVAHLVIRYCEALNGSAGRIDKPDYKPTENGTPAGDNPEYKLGGQPDGSDPAAKEISDE